MTVTEVTQVGAINSHLLRVEAERAEGGAPTQPMISVMARLSCAWCGLPMAALPLDDPEVKPAWRTGRPVHSLCTEAFDLDLHHQGVQARGAKRYRRGERVQ